jgi:murein DD-endopeptidase MepM/ murein hydrolase activator NlpD
MSSYIVNVGQTVQKGQVLGYEGSTGYSTGPHCHFEVRVNGQPKNPLLYIK